MLDKNPYKKGGMFEGASFLLFEKAKKLRKNMTGAEEVLWMYLRKGIGGYKVRRQHPIGIYIVDFFCYKFPGCVRRCRSLRELQTLTLLLPACFRRFKKTKYSIMSVR